nr:MAG TPA: hypothetical protein [Caudoviricetes sp.]
MFTINFGSTGRHHTFLGLGGGTLYGNLSVKKDIWEGGTALINKYLGKGAKAADSSKLDGQDSAYYLDYRHLTNKPAAYTLPVATATVLGGVKSKATGTTSGRDYNVEVKSDGTMKVNVPWTDTIKTATKSATTGIEVSAALESAPSFTGISHTHTVNDNGHIHKYAKTTAVISKENFIKTATFTATYDSKNYGMSFNLTIAAAKVDNNIS